jgi:hypothetical protein
MQTKEAEVLVISLSEAHNFFVSDGGYLSANIDG